LEEGKMTSLYLGKDKKGTGVSSLADAAPCTITPRGYLSCDGKTMGASPKLSYNAAGGFADVAPIGPVGDPGAIIDNYFVDDGKALHWKSEKFETLTGAKQILKAKSEGGQGGEAVFAFAKSGKDVKLVQLLGYTGGAREGYEKIVAGTAKAVTF
jgi:hypothetical protein